MWLDQRVYTGYLGVLEHFGVDDAVGPLCIQDATQITKPGDIETPFLSGVEEPRLKAATEHLEDVAPDWNKGATSQGR